MSKRKVDENNNQIIDSKRQKSTDLKLNHEKSLRIVHKILNYVNIVGKQTLYGEIASLPALMGLNVKGIGDIPLPITDIYAEKLTSILRKDVYGLYECNADEFFIKNPQWNEEIYKLVSNMAKSFICCGEFDIQLQKLVFYSNEIESKHGLNVPKMDNRKFGQVIIQLPSIFTGSKLFINTNGCLEEYDWGADLNRANYFCHFFAYQFGCEFEQQKVTTGYRLCLFYDLVWLLDKNLNICLGTNTEINLRNSLFFLNKPDIRLGIELNPLETNEVKFGLLKDANLERLNLLKRVNNEFSEDLKFKIFIVHAIGEFLKNQNNDKQGYNIYNRNYIQSVVDEDGIEIFNMSHNLDIEFFTEIICYQGPVLNEENFEGRSFWNRNSRIIRSPVKAKCHKYYLFLFPKKYEKNLFVKFDLETCIKTTYKELLCDTNSNFDSACETLELIIDELKDTPNLKIQSCYFYNLIESIKFIQDDKMIIELLNTKAFKIAYLSAEDILIEALVSILREFNWDILKEAFENFMLPLRYRTILQNINIVNQIIRTDNMEMAFELMQNYVLSILNEIHKLFKEILCSTRDFNDYMFFMVYKLLKTIRKFDKSNSEVWQQLVCNLEKLVLSPDYENILYNCEIIKRLNEIDQEIAANCFTTSVAIHVVCKECHINYLLSNENVENVFKILTTLYLFKDIQETKPKLKYAKWLESLITAILAEWDNNKLRKLLNLLKDESTEFLSNYQIQRLYNQRLKYLYRKTNCDWRMPYIKFDLPEIQAFYKSNTPEIEVNNNFTNITQARRWIITTFGSTIPVGYSVKLDAIGKGENSRVMIAKTRYYFKDSKPVDKYEVEIREINNLIS